MFGESSKPSPAYSFRAIATHERSHFGREGGIGYQVAEDAEARERPCMWHEYPTGGYDIGNSERCQLLSAMQKGS